MQSLPLFGRPDYKNLIPRLIDRPVGTFYDDYSAGHLRRKMSFRDTAGCLHKWRFIVNIMFFLTPKNDVAFISESETLRQALEKMEHRKFSCIPLLNEEGKYTGTISEGDLLWGLRHMNISDIHDMEEVSILAIPRRAAYKPVKANANIEDLLDCAINQNFVPVTDDLGFFIGIITRKEIIKYCYEELKKCKEQEL